MASRRILVAEDDETLRRRLGAFLRQHGYEVMLAQDCYQAVELALRERPDMLVLDVHMPAGSGFSVHERLRRHPDLALTPVIYMTRDRSSSIEQVAKRDGAVTLLYKPFDYEELLDAVRAALGPDADAA